MQRIVSNKREGLEKQYANDDAAKSISKPMSTKKETLPPQKTKRKQTLTSPSLRYVSEPGVFNGPGQRSDATAQARSCPAPFASS
jgi:hypothetical protein